MAVVIDELDHRREGERLREAVAALPVVNLYQPVIPAFPAGGDRREAQRLQVIRLHFLREATSKYLMSSGKTLLSGDIRTDTTPLPQCECVLALQLTGGIPHHEGAVRSVSQLLVHFLSKNAIMRI